jgi:uncharacterized repeat protein (TIGR03843 family)
MTAVWAPDVAPEVHQLLKHGAITSLQHIPWGSNYTFAATLEFEGRQGIGVYKPQRGERPLWDFPHGTLYLRERAAYIASAAFGWASIPPTVIRSGPHGVGSVQLYVDSEPPRSIRELQRSDNLDLARAAAFDFMTNNADRKAGHLLRDAAGKIWWIDHGLCFNIEPKVRTVLLHFCGEAVPAPVLAEIASFRSNSECVRAVGEVLATLIEPEEVEIFLKRVDWLLDRGRYPNLDPYHSNPWPPF